jgi:Fe-S-cluster-containing hydrogenase component 2
MKQMPKKSRPNKPSDVDIFQLLMETVGDKEKKRREELLAPLGIKEFFAEGCITINKKTCKGIECKLCIKACPTSALYWRAGEVGITKEVCIYCGSCVLSCIVDDCIRVSRKRSTGEVESFSRPRDFATLQHNINAKKRLRIIHDTFEEPDKYLEPTRPEQ